MGWWFGGWFDVLVVCGKSVCVDVEMDDFVVEVCLVGDR